jgi:hypothetical protein
MQALDPTQVLRQDSETKHEEWIYEDPEMHKYHGDRARDFVFGRGSNNPEQKAYGAKYNAYLHHVTVVNKWLRMDQKRCTWSVVPGHIKKAMFLAQKRMGLEWNLIEFVKKSR